jgi:hypothetical protein
VICLVGGKSEACTHHLHTHAHIDDMCASASARARETFRKDELHFVPLPNMYIGILTCHMCNNNTAA